MSRICILDITSTNLDSLSATLTIATIDDLTGTITNSPHTTSHGTLDLTSSIALNNQIIKKFQAATYQDLYYGGIELPKTIVSNVSDPIDELQTEIQSLKDLLDRTLAAESWSKIREGLLQSLNGIAPQEPLRLVIVTDDPRIQALPIESTSFIREKLGSRRPISVSFVPRRQPHKLVWQDPPKVLLVLGSQKDIIKPIHSEEIKKHFPSTVTFEILKQPTKEELINLVSDRAFDIIIIIGHSCTNNDSTDGRIKINDLDSISIQDFKQPFRSSVHRGLKLVILAGCSSIGAAKALASENIGVPNVIAFRLPVHYRTLRLFFKRLLKGWIGDSQSLEAALINTRGELSAIEPECPGSSILPILFTSPYDSPLKFPIKKRSISQKIIHYLVFRPLVTIKFRGKDVKIPPIALIGLAIATIGYFGTRPPGLEPACSLIPGGPITCGGGPIILTQDSKPKQQDKEDGANAIAKGDFDRAVELLTKAWDAEKDPETSIMLENAKLANQKLPIKSIAITIPGSRFTPQDIPTSMLKAVAFSQQQWNADPNHLWKLQVVIVNDENNKVEASKLADELLKRGIYAGIGSYSSEVTSLVKDIYKKHQTVLISSTSTATTLTNNNRDTYFFRVCSNNQISGKQIANYLRIHKYKNIVLFRTPGKTFSDSMTAALKANIKGVNIVKEFDFKGKGDIADYLKQAKISGAQAIVLIPDAYTSQDPERYRLLSLIKANNGSLPIIGNEVVKDQTLFNFTKQQLQKLTISLPWHPSSYQNDTINTPNFWGKKSQLDHRIAMTYDATQVLITALDRLPIDLEITESRRELQKIISNPTFDIAGITGQISFTGSDRSQPMNSLVQPQCDATKCSGFEPAR